MPGFDLGDRNKKETNIVVVMCKMRKAFHLDDSDKKKKRKLFCCANEYDAGGGIFLLNDREKGTNNSLIVMETMTSWISI